VRDADVLGDRGSEAAGTYSVRLRPPKYNAKYR